PTRREVEMAERITGMIPSVEKVRMVNSGTEATMSAVRVARGYTGRDKMIKFTGCYHGHGDSFLIAAGSGATTFGTPDSPGVTKGTARDTLTAPYGDLAAVEQLVDDNPDAVAAIIIEPVAGNMGCVVPPLDFLRGLRKLCDDQDIVLIFDEVMTGFRLAPGGAQERLGVRPDLTTLGKIIGGGMPVGAYGGRRDIMDQVSPAGPVYQAGTLSGNPVAMAAGLAVLQHLDEHRDEVYPALDRVGERLAAGLRPAAGDLTINQIGSMYTLFFRTGAVTDFEGAKASDLAAFGRYFQAMLRRGVYLAPSQFESLFLSTALTDALIDRVVAAHGEAMAEVREAAGA
ncbi:MAG: glutamate-1-semialdehyde 2,1-aminomutase, partial [Catalinimonas sp.]